MKPNVVRLMADYSSSGLWDGNGLMIEADDLRLPEDIAGRIKAWCQAYERTCNASQDEVDWAGFAEEGRSIACALKAHFGPETHVLYYDEARYQENPRRPRAEYLYAIEA